MLVQPVRYGNVHAECLGLMDNEHFFLLILLEIVGLKAKHASGSESRYPHGNSTLFSPFADRRRLSLVLACSSLSLNNPRVKRKTQV